MSSAPVPPASVSFDYFFDPLCGWCYAAAPALAGLVATYGAAVRYQPVGLFSGDGARPLSPSFADYAWSNDQRIQAMTGQPFSDAYLTQVLQGDGVRFDSGPATRALVALGTIDPALEPAFLRSVQIRRYVDGDDTARINVLTPIAVAVAAGAGHTLDPAAFADRLENDASLIYDTDRRITVARQGLSRMPGSGVPQLLVRVGENAHAVSGAPLYSGADVLLAHVAALAS